MQKRDQFKNQKQSQASIEAMASNNTTPHYNNVLITVQSDWRAVNPEEQRKTATTPALKNFIGRNFF